MSSIHEVAKEAGVSTATVSRVFSRPGLISSPTQKKVLETASRLNYHPNIARRKPQRDGMAERRASIRCPLIGYEFFADSPNLASQDSSFFAPVLAGAQNEAARLAMHLVVHTTDRNANLERLPDMLLDLPLAGMLLVNIGRVTAADLFARHAPHIVLLDNTDETACYDCVVSDGIGGAVVLTRYLFELGHRDIAFVASNTRTPSYRDRLRGFLAAHYEAGRTVDPENVISLDQTGKGNAAIYELMRGERRPTAVIGASDIQAFDMLSICRDLGLRVPGDISIAGFDDLESSAQVWPPLTTVRIDKELMGRTAVARLHARIEAAQRGTMPMQPITLQVPARLLTRASCAAVSL